jgi:hypothetical protein
MKKFLVAVFTAVLLVSLAALVAMTSGGNAAPSKTQYGKDAPTGPYLDLFNPPKDSSGTRTSYPANTAFHLSGGWSKGSDKTSDVQFMDNGVLLSNTDGLTFTYKDGNVGTRWVRNFPNGLSGTHVLTIQWTPCPQAGSAPISETPRWQGCSLSAEVNFP